MNTPVSNSASCSLCWATRDLYPLVSPGSLAGGDQLPPGICLLRGPHRPPLCSLPQAPWFPQNSERQGSSVPGRDGLAPSLFPGAEETVLEILWFCVCAYLLRDLRKPGFRGPVGLPKSRHVLVRVRSGGSCQSTGGGHAGEARQSLFPEPSGGPTVSTGRIMPLTVLRRP